MPSWEDFSQLIVSQIEEWLLPNFKNELLEISVVGDFERDKIVTLMNRYFGTLPPRKKAKMNHLPVKFPKGEIAVFEIQSEINKALINIGWQSDDYSNISRTRRLHMLASILEERVRLVVREKLGASYSPFVYNSSNRFIPGYGLIHARMIVEPNKIAGVKEAVLQICDDLVKNGVTEEELQRAKEPTLTSLKDTVRSNHYWLHSVLSLSTIYPKQLQWPTTILNDYASITAKEMTEYASKYLKREDAAFVVIRPSKGASSNMVEGKKISSLQ